ncbi:hypothetical protein SEVIR_3G031266v4 [Setaria viridis]
MVRCGVEALCNIISSGSCETYSFKFQLKKRDNTEPCGNLVNSHKSVVVPASDKMIFSTSSSYASNFKSSITKLMEWSLWMHSPQNQIDILSVNGIGIFSLEFLLQTNIFSITSQGQFGPIISSQKTTSSYQGSTWDAELAPTKRGGKWWRLRPHLCQVLVLCEGGIQPK